VRATSRHYLLSSARRRPHFKQKTFTSAGVPEPGSTSAKIGQLKADNNTLQVFYLGRDDLPEHDTGTKLWGANYELALGDETTTLGLTYLKLQSNRVPDRDGMAVYDGRLFTSPLRALPDLSFELDLLIALDLTGPGVHLSPSIGSSLPRLVNVRVQVVCSVAEAGRHMQGQGASIQLLESRNQRCDPIG
jgi:hypothetical protein